MYSRGDRIVSNKEEMSNFIEGLDLYNSRLIYEVTRPEIVKEVYNITVYEYRPDLIAKDYYGDSKYMGLIMLQVGDLTRLRRGEKILLIPKSKLDQILSGL